MLPGCAIGGSITISGQILDKLGAYCYRHSLLLPALFNIFVRVLTVEMITYILPASLPWPGAQMGNNLH